MVRVTRCHMVLLWIWNMELREIEKFNDWWTSGKVKSSLLKPYKRPLFNEILKYIEDRQILLVYGAQESG